MSKRSSAVATGSNGIAKDSGDSNQPGMSHASQFVARGHSLTGLRSVAVDKQKTLLSADVGHFSLVRAMHLADLITLMNGAPPSHTASRKRGC